MRQALLTAALALAAATAGAHDAGHAPQGVTGFDVYADAGTLHVISGEQAAGDKTRTLLYRRSQDGGASWSAPVRVDRPGQRVFPAHFGGEAQIAARGSRLLAAWTGYGSGFAGSGPILTALSADGGATWQPGPRPADSDADKGEAFIDIAADAGGFHMVWLDNRNRQQGLRFAASRDDGATWSANRTVEARTCECCGNRLLPGEHGALRVLYRGAQPRDMWLASSRDGGASWRREARVGAFDWQVDACPHTGGALAGQGAALQALVWTGADSAFGLHRIASGDAGATWGAPAAVGSETARRADIATAREGRMAMTWDEDGTAVMYALSSDGGATWTAPQRLSAPDVRATLPRVVFDGTRFVALWTETAGHGPTLLRSAVLAPPALPAADSR